MANGRGCIAAETKAVAGEIEYTNTFDKHKLLGPRCANEISSGAGNGETEHAEILRKTSAGVALIPLLLFPCLPY